MSHSPIIIIGAGLAGYFLAREYRKLDPTSPLMIITADDGSYYHKPQLSTAFTQKKSAAMLKTFSAEQMAAELNAIIRAQATVTSIDAAQKTITVENEKIAYHKLVLACGADVIKPVLRGHAIKEILSINHIYHYTDFQNALAHKKTVAILGAGLIGCEFANDLSNAGFNVHVIAPAKTPLSLLLPESVGLLLQKALAENGVQFHLSLMAEQIEKSNNLFELTLSDQSTVKADCVIAAIGLKPHIELARTAHIAINQGVLVNRFLETSQPDIYALGDCAEVAGHVLPYIAPIRHCSSALAKTLVGERTEVNYPAMAIGVKTPIYPIVVCPPKKELSGEWQIETTQEGVRALFYDDQKNLCGFILTRQCVKEKEQWLKQLPGLF